jgi:hypothetical protein
MYHKFRISLLTDLPIVNAKFLALGHRKIHKPAGNVVPRAIATPGPL